MESSQIIFTDTHCHLYAAEFDVDRTEMIDRAISNGVVQMMMPNIDTASMDRMLELHRQFPNNCFPMIGLHPCSVNSEYEKHLETISEYFNSHSFVGIGETGIDLYWDTTFRDLQVRAFEMQIQWALAKDLPVIIHSRESLDLNIDIIERHQTGNLKGIFHCFGGSVEQAKRIESIGFKMGIGGIITFKKNMLEEVLPGIPPESIVLETDSPYLAPTPYRGKRNEPAYIRLIAEKVASVIGLTLEELSLLTEANTQAVYGKKD